MVHTQVRVQGDQKFKLIFSYKMRLRPLGYLKPCLKKRNFTTFLTDCFKYMNTTSVD